MYFNVFTGPGFIVEDVTIYDDPRAGIEPFAYVPQLEARVNLLALLKRKLEFSSLRLVENAQGESTDINLVKTAAGPWNFQLLLSSAPALSGSMPAIKMRTGRVNFKFADTKSVFYLNDADFDVAPSDDFLIGGKLRKALRRALAYRSGANRPKLSGISSFADDGIVKSWTCVWSWNAAPSKKSRACWINTASDYTASSRSMRSYRARRRICSSPVIFKSTTCIAGTCCPSVVADGARHIRGIAWTCEMAIGLLSKAQTIRPVQSLSNSGPGIFWEARIGMPARV